MGYQASNSFRTLTHWQSGAAGGFTPVPRTAPIYYGFMIDGKPYLFPFECYSADSDFEYESIAGWATYAMQAVPTTYYGYSFDVSGIEPLCSGKKYGEDGRVYFRAIYQLYEKSPIAWKTRETKGKAKNNEVVVNSEITYNAGDSCGVCIPVVTKYVFLEGECDVEDEEKLPEWLQSYPKLAGYADSDFTAPSLKPSLFNSAGKKEKEWVEIEKDDSTDSWYRCGGLYGTNLPLTAEENLGRYSCGYAGVGPLSLAGETYNRYPDLGSSVTFLGDVPLIRTKSTTIPSIKTVGLNYSCGVDRIKPIKESTTAWYDLTCDYEVCRFELDEGILWNNEVEDV